jgi:hypothetical protein
VEFGLCKSQQEMTVRPVLSLIIRSSIMEIPRRRSIGGNISARFLLTDMSILKRMGGDEMSILKRKGGDEVSILKRTDHGSRQCKK